MGIPRYWDAERTEQFRACVLELATPVGPSPRLVLQGKVVVMRDAGELYRQRCDPGVTDPALQLGKTLLVALGVLESGTAGQKSVDSARWVDPTVEITQAKIDAFYRAKHARQVERVRLRSSGRK